MNIILGVLLRQSLPDCGFPSRFLDFRPEFSDDLHFIGNTSEIQDISKNPPKNLPRGQTAKKQDKSLRPTQRVKHEWHEQAFPGRRVLPANPGAHSQGDYRHPFQKCHFAKDSGGSGLSSSFRNPSHRGISRAWFGFK